MAVRCTKAQYSRCLNLYVSLETAPATVILQHFILGEFGRESFLYRSLLNCSDFILHPTRGSSVAYRMLLYLGLVSDAVASVAPLYSLWVVLSVIETAAAHIIFCKFLLKIWSTFANHGLSS